MNIIFAIVTITTIGTHADGRPSVTQITPITSMEECEKIAATINSPKRKGAWRFEASCREDLPITREASK